MLLKLREVARQVGVSYPTIKQWIYQGKLRSVRTPGGHHRISDRELDRFLANRGGSRDGRRKKESGLRSDQTQRRISARSSAGEGLRISGRNKLTGVVREIELDGLLARVVLAIGRQEITAVITREACLELGLKIKEPATALIKATEVMIIK
ncbi:MAG: helix-turn-helix transcriptional regulator [Acidobacteriota bacterium]